MKRIVALFLAVTLLIGVMGTATAAVEITSTPEITAPTVKSATIDADGGITVVPGDTDYQDGQWGEVLVYRENYGYNQWYSVYYNADKKAFISEDYYKDQIKGGTIQRIELDKSTNKSETSGKTNVFTNIYYEFYYNKDLKLIEAKMSKSIDTYSDGNIVKYEQERREEEYDEEEGYLTQKETSYGVTEWDEKRSSVEKKNKETIWLDEDGVYRSYKYTGENTYDKEGDILKEVTESENTNKDGKVTGTDKSTTTYTYNQEKNERTVTENGESTSNNEYGVLIATEKISSTEKEKKFEAGDGWYYWTDVENNSDQTRLNKDGKIVYTKTSSSKDGVTKSETKSYDEFGVLSFGSSSVSDNFENHNEYFDRFGKTSETTSKYEAVKDENGNQIGTRLANTTEIKYENYKGGANVKSKETVSKPEYKKLEDGGTRTLQHQTSTEYDKYGAVTSTETRDESYDETKDEITQKTVTVNYVGKPVTAEMHDKVESISIRKLAKNDASVNSTSIYSGDSTNTTTYYDWDGSVEKKVVQSRESTKDDEGNETTTQINMTYSDDGKTVVSGSKQISGYDKNGRYFYKYDSVSSNGRSISYDDSYDEKEAGWVTVRTETDSEGWSNVERSDKNGKVTTYYNPDKKEYGKQTYSVDMNENGQRTASNKYTDANGKLVYERSDRVRIDWRLG